MHAINKRIINSQNAVRGRRFRSLIGHYPVLFLVVTSTKQIKLINHDKQTNKAAAN